MSSTNERKGMIMKEYGYVGWSGAKDVTYRVRGVGIGDPVVYAATLVKQGDEDVRLYALPRPSEKKAALGFLLRNVDRLEPIPSPEAREFLVAAAAGNVSLRAGRKITARVTERFRIASAAIGGVSMNEAEIAADAEPAQNLVNFDMPAPPFAPEPEYSTEEVEASLNEFLSDINTDIVPEFEPTEVVTYGPLAYLMNMEEDVPTNEEFAPDTSVPPPPPPALKPEKKGKSKKAT